MINKIIEKLKNKNVAILGFGREGKSTYEFIRKYLKDTFITIIDYKNVLEENNYLKDDTNINIIYGENYLDNLELYDLVIKTPGISLKDIDATNINITSQIELVLEVCRNQVIGVTGTKGKSTTSSLIYEILKKAGKPVMLAGNIGIPVFNELEKINDDTYIVLEMSSHQLEYLKTSPHIGIILNLFEDHLDHAGSVKHYHECKMNMFKNQIADDIMIYCSDNKALKELVENSNFKGKKYTVNLEDKASIYKDNDYIHYENNSYNIQKLKTNLLGNHNLENMMVAMLVSKIIGINDDSILSAISEFKSLPYRLEYIGTVNKVKYYIDTLATIPNATIDAIKAIPDINTLIFGGMDRGISYEGFAEELEKSNIEHFICMPTTGHTIGKSLPTDRTFFVETLEEACTLAKKITKENTSCILSPAAASYEQFKNYAEKGDRFKELILNNK